MIFFVFNKISFKNDKYRKKWAKDLRICFLLFSFIHLFKLFLCTINDPEHQNAPARWIGDKKLMEVIVMCGKYADFDPKIGNSTTFQLAANGNGF